MILNWNFDDTDGDTVFLIFCIVVAVAILIILCCCFCCCRRCCKKSSRIEIVDDDMGINHPIGTSSPRLQNGNDTSIQLEDIEEDNNINT